MKIINKDGMFLKEVHKGFLWKKKRYYCGSVQSFTSINSNEFLIEADWFDSLLPMYQIMVYKREYASAYKSSMKNVNLD